MTRKSDPRRMLDVRGDLGVDFEALAEALGFDDAERAARDWMTNGWIYPWEESREVARRLADSGHTWIIYHDDYPELAVTYRRITT